MVGDALHTHGGVVSAQEARLADAGLIAVQGPTPLDVRTGVLIGPGSTQLVSGTASTAPMQVAVAPHQWVTSRGAANGPYRGSLDATVLVDLAAAPASGSRIDVVYVKQQDSTPGVPTPDGVTAPLYAVVQGVETTGTPAKPALPVGAIELATATVAAGATATNGAGVTITNTARQTVPRGGVLPERTQAALGDGAHRGQLAYDLATGRLLVWDGQWTKCGGPRETLLADADAGVTVLTVSPGGAATVKTGSFNSPVAAATGLMRVTFGASVTSSTIYRVDLLVNSVLTDSQLLDTSADRPPLTLLGAASVRAGSNDYAIELRNVAGGDVTSRWLGLRVTI